MLDGGVVNLELDKNGYGIGELVNLFVIVLNVELIMVKVKLKKFVLVNLVGVFKKVVFLNFDIIFCSWGDD